jgi:hypothetical protein
MKSLITLFTLSICLFLNAFSQNVVVVVIDGARYTETFGDPEYTYIPHMAELAKSGSYVDNMYNQHQTYTSQAMPAIWTGGWDGVYNLTYEGQETQATYSPSVFEYFRKQKNVDETECIYTIKYVSSLWLQSFHADYGPDYWPLTICDGSTDNDVLANSLEAIENHHPQFIFVYLAEVDQAGHTGNWETYTSAIQNADEAVHTLWTTLQADDFYKDKTTMLVTNDHGRHDDEHGGFTGHGCSCNGCRQIMLLALGPQIKENFVSTETYELADVAVTAAYILDVEPELATGNIITNIFEPTDVSTPNVGSDINFIYNNNSIQFELLKPEAITLSVYDMLGREIEILAQNKLCEGVNKFQISNIKQSGIYIIKLQFNNNLISKKIFKN